MTVHFKVQTQTQLDFMTFKRQPQVQNEMMKSYSFSFHKNDDRPLHQNKFKIISVKRPK